MSILTREPDTYESEYLGMRLPIMCVAWGLGHQNKEQFLADCLEAFPGLLVCDNIGWLGRYAYYQKAVPSASCGIYVPSETWGLLPTPAGGIPATHYIVEKPTPSYVAHVYVRNYAGGFLSCKPGGKGSFRATILEVEGSDIGLDRFADEQYTRESRRRFLEHQERLFVTIDGRTYSRNHPAAFKLTGATHPQD